MSTTNDNKTDEGGPAMPPDSAQSTSNTDIYKLLIQTRGDISALAANQANMIHSVNNIEEQLSAINGRTRNTEQACAAEEAWRDGHDKRHTAIDDDIKALRGRVNTYSSLNAGLALLGSAIAALISRFP